MVNSKIQLRDVSYSQHLYKSVLGVVVLVALLVAIGTMRPSRSNPNLPVDNASRNHNGEAVAVLR
jgi:hypothetical protein